nr:hypothetical protein [uncultured Flavobacterium sp.]
MWGETDDFNNSFNEFTEYYQGVIKHKNPIAYVNRALDLLKEFQFRAIHGMCKEEEEFVYEEFVEELQLHQNLFDTYIDFDLSKIEAWEDFIVDQKLRFVKPYEIHYSFSENEQFIENVFNQYQNSEIDVDELLSLLKNPVYDYQENAANLSNNAFFNHYIYAELGKMDPHNKEHDALTLEMQNQKELIALGYLNKLQRILELDSED